MPFICNNFEEMPVPEFETVIDDRDEYELFQDHVKLAKSIANKILAKFRNSCTIKLEKDDLEQEALLALFEAAKKYDQTKGLKFSTYAHYCVSGHLYKFVFRKSSTIRLPRMDRLEREDRIKVLNNLIVSSLDYKVSSASEELDFNATVGEVLGEWDRGIDNIEVKLVLDQILTETEKEIITRIYFQGKAQNVVANELGLPHASMNKKHKKTLLKIKSIFETLDLVI